MPKIAENNREYIHERIKHPIPISLALSKRRHAASTDKHCFLLRLLKLVSTKHLVPIQSCSPAKFIAPLGQHGAGELVNDAINEIAVFTGGRLKRQIMSVDEERGHQSSFMPSNYSRFHQRLAPNPSLAMISSSIPQGLLDLEQFVLEAPFLIYLDESLENLHHHHHSVGNGNREGSNANRSQQLHPSRANSRVTIRCNTSHIRHTRLASFMNL